MENKTAEIDPDPNADSELEPDLERLRMTLTEAIWSEEPAQLRFELEACPAWALWDILNSPIAYPTHEPDSKPQVSFVSVLCEVIHLVQQSNT
jgi:hypothetical protein